MTPPLLVELLCPNCQKHHWVIDCDFRAAFMAGGVDVDYDQRDYRCRHCGRTGTGHKVLQKSPPTFLIDLPDRRMGAGTSETWNYWKAILREHFPDHPKVKSKASNKAAWWRFW